MKRILFALAILWLSVGYSQTYYYPSLPRDTVYGEEEGGSRSGSCASPDGPVLTPVLLTPPLDYYADLYDPGYCYDIDTIKNATYCWTFTAQCTGISLNTGFSFTAGGAFSLWFSSFKLYTCSPSCTLVGTGLVFTSLTIGQCYTWCFDTHMTGGGADGGFTALCPYVICNTVLPIEILNFEAYRLGDKAILHWVTAENLTCEKFIAQKSQDGEVFVDIDSTECTQGKTDFYANDIMTGDTYYRIAQLNSDGSRENTEIVFLSLDNVAETLLRTYDIMGNLVEYSENLSPGIYLQEWSTENFTYWKKVVKR